MAAAVNTSVGANGSGTSLTTGSVTPGGSDTAVFAVIGGDASAATGAKYGGSGGTSLSQIGANQAIGFGSVRLNAWGTAPSPTSSTTGYADYGATSQGSAATSFAFLTGADQTSPFGTEVQDSDSAIAASMVASVALTGLTPGQLVMAGLGVLHFSTLGIVSNNGGTTVIEFRQGGGGNRVSTAILYGVADGSGNLTLEALVTQPGSDFFAYAISALPVNDAAGGGATEEVTGSAATGAVGTAVPAHALAISGDSAAGVAGSVGLAVSIGLTGTIATASVGTVSPDGAVALNGASAAAGVGTVSASAGVVVAISGVAAAGALGSTGLDRVGTLSSVDANAQLGLLTALSGRALTGVNAGGAVGSFEPAWALQLAGAAVITYLGSLAATGGTETVIRLSASPANQRLQQSKRYGSRQNTKRPSATQSRTR